VLSLILFTHVALHTESKELLIDVPCHLLYFLHVQHRIQKVRGSRLTSLVIKFILFTCTGPCTESKWIPIDVLYHLILFIRSYTGSRLMYHHTFYTQQSSAYEKQGASIYLYPSGIQLKLFKVLYKLTKVYYNLQKNYKRSGLLLPSNLASAEKPYRDIKCWVVS
jgi:hypothetical protein